MECWVLQGSSISEGYHKLLVCRYILCCVRGGELHSDTPIIALQWVTPDMWEHTLKSTQFPRSLSGQILTRIVTSGGTDLGMGWTTIALPISPNTVPFWGMLTTCFQVVSQPRIPWVSSHQTQHSNVAATSQQKYYKLCLSIPVQDHRWAMLSNGDKVQPASDNSWQWTELCAFCNSYFSINMQSYCTSSCEGVWGGLAQWSQLVNILWWARSLVYCCHLNVIELSAFLSCWGPQKGPWYIHSFQHPTAPFPGCSSVHHYLLMWTQHQLTVEIEDMFALHNSEHPSERHGYGACALWGLSWCRPSHPVLLFPMD